MTDYQKQVAEALLSIDAIGFKPQEPITFKSGIISPVYVDNRILPYHPEQWHVVINGMKQLMTEQDFTFDLIAGIAVGGVPHSSALAYAMQVPSVFVRKEAKGHGRGQRIEGGNVDNKSVLLVEDLVTTGSSSLSGVDALREAGCIINDCLAIVSYGFSDAQNAFQQAQVWLHTLTTFDIILQTALDMNKFSQGTMAIIKDWFTDPHGWAKRQGFA